jgi:hypothetical protein
MLVRRLIVLVLLACLPLAAQDPQPESTGHSLSGAVHDGRGQPVIGAWLEIRATQSGAITAAAFEGPPLKSMRSGPNGRWAFQHLPPGTWLLTVAARIEPPTEGAAPLSDEEFEKMARPGADQRLPDGVALTRIIRHFETGQSATTEQMDLGLALAPRPAQPLRGQLVGAFQPDTYGYEVQLVRATQLAGGGSMSSSVTSVGGGTVTSTSSVTTVVTTGSSSTTVDGVSDPPAPRFSTVPDREGFFDFGSLDVKDEDWVSVETVRLSDGATTARATVFGAPLGTLEASETGIEIAIEAKHTVTVRAVRADGTSIADADWIECNVWAEGSVSATTLDKAGTEMALAPGTYVARATLGEFASSLTAFEVVANGPTEVTLLLQPCPRFTVRFVDVNGAPLGDCYPRLGTEATREFPSPCRVPVECEAGEVKLQGVLPGTYDVRFKMRGKDAVTQRVDLQPDGVIVVTLP